MPGKLRQYIAEPIIKLLVSLALLIAVVSAVTHYANLYVYQYYEEPGRQQIANLKNKEKLGQIIKRQLLLVNSDYRRMLLTENSMQRKLLHKGLIQSLLHTKAVIQVLRNGGTIVDVQLVNFYDKDEIREEISWQNNQSQIPTDVINIAPKIVTLQQLISQSYRILTEITASDKISADKQSDLQIIAKKTDTILTRLREDTNKIYYDISQSNKQIEQQINSNRTLANKFSLLGNIVAEFFVLIYVFVIAKKILVIIQQQKEAENKLQESNHSLSVIMENMPFGVIVVDKNKNVRMVNNAALKLMGCHEQDVVGHICHQKICPAEKHKCPYWDLGNRVDAAERIVLAKDSHEIPVLKSIIPITLNHEELLLEAFVDISRQKENEQEINKLNLMNEGLLQSIPIPFVIIRKDETLLYANESALTLMNKAESEKKCWQALTNNKLHCDPAICPLNKNLQKNDVYNFERSDILGGGVFQITCVPIVYRGQEAIIELFFDITPEKNAQKSLQLAKEVAEEATRAKSEFLASMSHEIRTPMNAIIGFTDMMMETEMTSQQRDYINSVNNAGNGLLILINDILDFSKIIADKMDIENIEFDLSQMVHQLISINNVHAENKGLKLVYEMPPLDRKIIGDPHRIRQILTNLIGNAIKFTEQGQVSLCVDIIEQSIDDVSVNFIIADTGIGIPKDRQQAIFESFSQADGSTTRNFGGTGLGLTISNKLVSLLGGDCLQVSSEPGKGTSFSFQLSFELGSQCQSDKSDADKDEKIRQITITPYHILLVEDNLVNIKLATALLKKQGHTIVTAKNGQLGVEAALSEEFDFCFMDVQMPVMDGLTATREIRKHGVLQKGTAEPLPIIAMTANAMKGDRQDCLDAGMNDYISKPIKFDVIKKVIIRNS